MRAAVLHGPGDLRIDEVPVPVPGPGEVLVQVRVTGICGSDVARVVSGAAHTYPMVLGHEFSGVVVELGGGTSTVTTGDRVIGVPLQPCHACVDCRRGHFGQCARYSFVGSRTQGAWAEYVVLPEQNILPFDDQLTFEEAAMVEPVTVALHALRNAGAIKDAQVAIIGAGTIGLFALQCARVLGAHRVSVFDIDDAKLALARDLGADLVVDPRSAQARAVWEAETDGRGYPVVLESAGAVEAIRQTFDLVAKHGAVVLVGSPPSEVAFDQRHFDQLNRKEFTLTGSWMSYSHPFPGDEWPLALHFVRQKAIACTELVHGTFALEDIGSAFDLYHQGRSVHGKILVYPGRDGATGGLSDIERQQRRVK